MFYLNDSQQERQYDFVHKEKPLLDSKPEIKKYGIPVMYSTLEDMIHNRSKITTDDYLKKKPDDYERKTPLTFMDWMDSIPLGRDYMGFGLRGFWIVGDTKSYHSATDKDPYRVSVHEQIHKGMAMWDKNHPEWLVRMIENLRLGDENYN